MMKHILPEDAMMIAAAENAQEGVINVRDLSLLTGIAESQLSKFAKNGFLEHYGEYHGKRFYNFQTIVTWAIGSRNNDEARRTIREGMEKKLRENNCPYSIEQIESSGDAGSKIAITWKVRAAA